MKELPSRSRMDQRRRDLTLLILLVLLSSLPFLNRAIHLDENTYLALARNVSHHFWFPQDLNGLWFGIPVLNFSGHTHPVGLAYYLALLLNLSPHGAEWPLRLGFLVFPLGYAVAGYFLAARFTKHPFWTAALMMVTPAVLVFSPTLMPDLPMTTFWLFAVVSFLGGLEEGRFWKLILAGILLICATLISYQAIFMSVLLAIYARIRGERRARVFVCLASPIVFLAIYWYAGYLHYGFFVAARGAKYLALGNIFGLEYFRQKVLGMLSTLGATTIFTFSLLWLFGRSLGWKNSCIVALLTAVSCLFVPTDYSPFEYAEFFLFAVAGTMLLWFMTRSLVRTLKMVVSGDPSKASDLFLVLWVLGVALYTVFLAEFTAARYVTPLVPPLAICFVRRVEEFSLGDEKGWNNFLRVTTFATWCLAVGIAYADSQFVGSYREFSQWFSWKYAQPGGTVWVGSEAGLRFYMERVGAHPVVNGYSPVLPSVLPGSAWGEAHFGKPALNDLLVRPTTFLRYALRPDLELSAVIDSRTLTSPFPIRSYGPEAHAGLHGTNVGLLPFAFSRLPLDRIEISRYNIFAAEFNQAKKETPSGQPILETLFTVHGKRQAVIGMPPTAKLVYALKVSPGTDLRGQWGMDDSMAEMTKCESNLAILIQGSGQPASVVCDQHSIVLTPSTMVAALTPFGEFDCNLNLFENQEVNITFQSNSMARDSGQCPTLGIWNLRFEPTATSR